MSVAGRPLELRLHTRAAIFRNQLEPAIRRQICVPYFFTMLIPIPGTANNSASLRGQVAAIARSARSPKTRNAGIFLFFASLNRQARKVCSIRIFGSGTAAPVLACPDCARALAPENVLDLLEFLFR